MYRNRELLRALAIFLWILFADGEVTKIVVFNYIECSLKGKVFSKVVCQRASSQKMNIEVTIGNQPADNIFGLSEFSVMPKGQRKMRPLKNLKLNVCNLKKNSKMQSLLGSCYRALSRAADTTILMRGLTLDHEIPQYLPEANWTWKTMFYANKELGLEVKIAGGFYENASDTVI